MLHDGNDNIDQLQLVQSVDLNDTVFEQEFTTNLKYHSRNTEDEEDSDHLPLVSSKRVIGVNALLSPVLPPSAPRLFIESAIFSTHGRTRLESGLALKIFPEGMCATKLLYRLTTHGSSSSAFHSNCDDSGATITFITTELEGVTYIFGAYMPIPFVKSDKYITTD